MKVQITDSGDFFYSGFEPSIRVDGVIAGFSSDGTLVTFGWSARNLKYVLGDSSDN